MIAMTYWLMSIADCATATVSLTLGIGVMFVLGAEHLRKKQLLMYVTAAALVYIGARQRPWRHRGGDYRARTRSDPVGPDGAVGGRAGDSDKPPARCRVRKLLAGRTPGEALEHLELPAEPGAQRLRRDIHSGWMARGRRAGRSSSARITAGPRRSWFPCRPAVASRWPFWPPCS